MAGSRVHKLGSIFERISNLLESDAFKGYEKPIWYDVYEQHPPKYEPRFDRRAPDIEIKDIFYEEDVLRAKIHKVVSIKFFDLTSLSNVTPTKSLIESCQGIMKAENVDVDGAIKKMRLQKHFMKKENKKKVDVAV